MCEILFEVVEKVKFAKCFIWCRAVVSRELAETVMCSSVLHLFFICSSRWAVSYIFNQATPRCLSRLSFTSYELRVRTVLNQVNASGVKWSVWHHIANPLWQHVWAITCFACLWSENSKRFRFEAFFAAFHFIFTSTQFAVNHDSAILNRPDEDCYVMRITCEKMEHIKHIVCRWGGSTRGLFAQDCGNDWPADAFVTVLTSYSIACLLPKKLLSNFVRFKGEMSTSSVVVMSVQDNKLRMKQKTLVLVVHGSCGPIQRVDLAYVPHDRRGHWYETKEDDDPM